MTGSLIYHLVVFDLVVFGVPPSFFKTCILTFQARKQSLYLEIHLPTFVFVVPKQPPKLVLRATSSSYIDVGGMASELSESSSSSDIHTPAISVDEQQEHAGAAGTTEQGLDNDVMAVQDDLALGLELMMRKTQIESVHESGEKAQSNRETTLTMIGE